nr:SCO family protein [Acidovorax sp. JHL-3]
MSKSSARKLRRMSSGPQDAKVERRRLALVFGIFMLLAAPTVFLVQSRSYPTASPFKLIDITGAGYAGDFLLPDHNGVTRSLKDFNGEVAVVFFGFTQCPDVCPTTLTEVVQARKLMGSDGAKLKAIFVTVDPERDTFPVLKTYMANFDPAFVALRPDPGQLQQLAKEFKLHIRKNPGQSPTSYTMDHTAASFVYDPRGRLRLYARYGAGAEALAHDAKLLLNGA